MRKTAIALATIVALAGSAAFAASKSDDQFLRSVIKGNLAEISMGELAQEKGQSEAVRAFGKTLVVDHSAANEKAIGLAESLGIKVPKKPKKKAQELRDELAKLEPEAFDARFAEEMVKDHKKDVRAFEAKAEESGDVGAFAKETLPTLRSHLEASQSLIGAKSASR